MEPTFETVVERYSAPLYRLAYSWCGNREDAEDVLQEVFLKYLRKKPRFAEETQRRAWLMTVTVNGCRDLLRSRSRRRTVPMESAAALAAPEAEKHPEVAEALASLPPPDRAMVYLFYYESLPAREIARTLGTTEGAVRTRLTRARGKLRDLLGGNDDAEG